MPFSSTSLLQFDELKELLARYAGSSAGRGLILALTPHNDHFLLESDLAEAGEAIGYLREVSGAQETARGAAIRLRFDQLRDVELAVRTLRVEGAALEGREIVDLFHTLSIAGEYRGLLAAVATLSEFGRFARHCTSLPASVFARCEPGG
jgi:dsDNA-specific endonuclease/ATPase MutS2